MKHCIICVITKYNSAIYTVRIPCQFNGLHASINKNRHCTGSTELAASHVGLFMPIVPESALPFEIFVTNVKLY